MLIQKGGIFRRIDEKNLAKYKEKGYSAVEKKVPETSAAPSAVKAGGKDGSAGK